MFNNRQLAIIDMLQTKDKVTVTELTEQLGVSLVTIRQDLKKLEERGVLKRTHGGAVPVVSGYDISTRMWNHYEAKQRIAQAAAALIADGETVIVETGSTCSLLARELANKRGVTIITNSVFLTNFVRDCPGLEVILLGGAYQHDAETNVGPLTKLCLSQFSVDKCFIGTDALSEEKGFSSMNLFRAEVIRYMAQAASKTIVLTTSDKVGANATASVFPLSEIHAVITDTELDGAQEKILRSAGVNVIKA